MHSKQRLSASRSSKPPSVTLQFVVLIFVISWVLECWAAVLEFLEVSTHTAY